MSLKAKLEAVIYAAEEPVTLAQLATLFAEDALALQAEQQASVSVPAAEPLPLIAGKDSTDEVLLEPAEETACAESDEPSPEPAAEPASSESTTINSSPNASAPEAEPAAEDETAAEPAAEPVPGTEPEAEADPAATLEDLAAEEKRKARQQDRQVRNILRSLLDELIADYATDERGMEIREIAGGFRMATKPEYHDAVRAFIKSLKPALKLSLPALETLAVIAYKQPVTAPEINEIRGVEASGVLGSLLARKLIATAGRKPVIGRPILYKTTREFLLRFGLKDVGELPSMEEFEKMAASELDEPELAPEAAPAGPIGKTKSAEEEREFEETASNTPVDELGDTSAGEKQIAPDSEEQPPSAAQAEMEDLHGD
jgi:segregation and condensation protein B